MDEVIISERYSRVLKKRVIVKGDRSSYPVEFAECSIGIDLVKCEGSGEHLAHLADSKYFSGDRFEGDCTVGEGSHFLDRDLERCLLNVYAGEECLLTLSYAPAGPIVSCRLRLLRLGAAEQRDPPFKLRRASRLKDDGVALVAAGRTVEAFERFAKAARLLRSVAREELEILPDGDRAELDRCRAKLYNNLAHCQLLFGEHEAAVRLCDAVLQIEPDNVKALYRRGSAQTALNNWEAAHRDMGRVLTLDPKVTEAKSKMVILNKKMNTINEAYTRTIQNMFK